MAATSYQVEPNYRNTHYDMVKQFHFMFDHPIAETKLETIPDKLKDFRYKLIKEEFDEFTEAFKEKDFGEMADALCDMSYVVNGAGICFGIDLFEELENYEFDISTPKDFSNKVYLMMFRDNDKELIQMITSLKKSVDSYLQTTNIDDITKCLCTILNETYKFGYYMGFDMDSMFKEVHASNMTKLCKTEEEAIESVEKYELDGRYEEPSYKEKNGYFVVYDAKTSKILKNHKWRMPNLKQFMRLQMYHH